MKTRFSLLLLTFLLAARCVFGATLMFSGTAPTPGTDAISNFAGAAFDAANVGGSGTNADGGVNNGAANDATTYVSNNRPAQGQTFTTGSNPGGYTISSITVQAAGYTNNIATGTNVSSYSLASTSSTFRVRVGRLSGTTFIPYSVEYAASGGKDNPGTGSSANDSGVFLTFLLKAPIVLQPNTVYAFDIGTTGDYFEMLGISNAAAYAGGSAYTSGSNGVPAGTITSQGGDRVFLIDLTAYTPPTPVPGAFVHPGLLNTEADYERMRTKVALGQEPWLSNYNALKSSWMAQTGGWVPHAQATITRGATNDTSRLYNDIAVAYSSALCWKITGDTAYADQAVTILNAWAYTFTSVAGDTNVALTELYGCQFAAVAEIMRTYPGWAPADMAQFQTMIYNVFYPLANNFLTGHFGTSYDHYWANWDLASMTTIFAIGVLNDNPTLTNQTIDYFKNGVGNGCIDRTVNFIHPGYLGQGQEMGRDQGHATLDIAQLAALCQMAWNQGVDFFGYENNRVLAMAEYTAKYNLWQDVPWTNYAYGPNWAPWLQTGPASGSRGQTSRPGWPTLYNHYVNLMGMSAPFCKQLADNMGTGWSFNGDSLGWDQLTTALPPITTGSNPSGLRAMLNGGHPQLSWWGSAYATGYNVKRSTTAGGPYTTIASGVTTNTYTDYNPVAGVANYYVVSGSASGAAETGNSNEAPAVLGCPVYTQLTFNETSGTTAADSTGNGWSGTLVNGASWTSGKSGNAVNLSKASSQYVSLPPGIVADFSDVSISAWVYQNSASNSARIFDFGSGDNAYGGVDPWKNTEWLAERYMYLAPQSGSGKIRFGISHSAGPGEEGIDGANALPTGQWVHVCVTLSGGVGTLYVNGVVVGQNVNMPMTPIQFPPTTQNYIGKSQWRSDPYFDGKIDDFRIYRGALSTGQIYTLATGQAPAAPAPAPATFTMAAQPGGSMILNWSAVSGATSYTVWRSTTPGGPYTAIASLLTGTTYTDTGLTAGTTYYYVVDAANTGGDGAYSTQVSAVALPPIPGNPTSLVATSASSTSVSLIWTAASNSASYNIKRSLASGGPYTTVATGVTATTYTNTGLINGTTYYYVVSAVNAAGEGPNSNESNATPSNLLMQLKLDETSGTTAWDSTYHGWNGSTVNSPAWTTGKLGNAISLASGSSQYLTIPSGAVSGLGDFTISAWVKLNSLNTWARIFDFGTGTTNYMMLTTQSSSAGKMRYEIVNGGVSQQINSSSIVTGTGEWTHVAVTLSGSMGTLYINGTVAGTNSAMTLTPSNLGNTSQNWIGRSQWSADPYLNGLVDDFRIYTRALSASEISSAVSSPLSAPQNVVATSGYQQVGVAWIAVSNATGYVLRSSTVSGGPYTTVASGLTSLSFTQTNLTPGVTYYYVVSAVNATGEGPNSAEASAGALATPGAPVGFSATAGNGTVLLKWTVSGDAATYNVYRSNSSGSDYTLLADGLTGGAYSDTGLADGSTYYYVVTGVNPGGEGPTSVEASATPVSPPVITSATTANGTSGGAFSYQITAANAPTSFAASGLPAGLHLNTTTGVISGTPSVSGTYNATISASNVGGTGSATLTITVQVVTPSAPTGLTAARGDATVVLSWTASSGAASYNVKRSLTSGSGYTTVASNVTTLNFTNTGLTNGTPYYYVVSAVNAAGESANSSQVSATPSSVSSDWFTQLFSNNNTTDNTTFTFTPANNTNKYIVSRRTGITQFPTSTSGATTIAAGDDTSTKVTLSGTAKVSLYGVSYSSFYVGSNGYLTFSGSDTSYRSSTTTHFNQPRISVLFDDLDATSQGTVSCLQLSDRVAVTWQNVPVYGSSNSNNFQVEMFFDGKIRITCLAIADANGLIGLSAGGGKPGAFAQSTFSNYPAPLAAPAGLTVSGSDSVITLKWSDVVGASSYNVKRTLTSGSNYAVVGSGLNPTSFSDTGLTNGTTYYYIVTAVNSLVGEGIDSTEVSATPLPPPSAPNGVATFPGNNLVGLSWNASSGAKSYSVWRSAVSGSDYTLLTTLSGTSYIDSTALNGTTYYYVLTSTNDTGTSAYSTEVAATPVAPPAITSALSVTGTNGVGFSYQITASNNPTKFAATGLPPGLSVSTETGLITGTPTVTGVYNVILGANSFSGTGSATLVLTLLPPPPEITSAGTATGMIGTTFSYQIMASNSPSGYGASGLPSGLSVSSETGLISGTPSVTGTFSTVISASNPQGTGTASLTITIVPTPPSAPTGLIATGTNAAVALSWTASPTATSYNVWRSMTSGTGYAMVASGVTPTSYSDTNVVNYSTYYYVVSAVNSGGESPISNEASATPMPPGIWMGNGADSLWQTAANWSLSAVPGTSGTATFSSSGNGFTTVSLGSGATIGAILFDTVNAAAYTIGAGAVGSQALTLSTAGNAITVNSTVINNQLLRANLMLATTGTYALTNNNSTTSTLTVAGGISASTPGTKVLQIAGSGNTNLSGAIATSGTVNLLKTGSGTLTLSGSGTLSGGAISGYGNGGNNFGAVVLGGTTAIASGTYTSNSEFVVGGVTSNGGTGVNTNLTMTGGSLVVNNWLSLGRGNGTGAVSSDMVLNNNASVTASNMSEGYNANSSSNLPKGSLTLNNSSVLNIASGGAFYIAETPGANFTTTLNGSSQLNAPGAGTYRIGAGGGGGGTGTLILNGSSAATFGTNPLYVGYISGTGRLTLNGGTLTAGGGVRIGASTAATNSEAGVVTVNAGTLTSAGDLYVGGGGAASSGASAQLNIAGGTVNVATTALKWLYWGAYDTVAGQVTITSGTLNLNTNSWIKANVNGNTGANVFTINGGAVNFYSNNGSAGGGMLGGTGALDMQAAGTSTAYNNTVNLNGGTLAVPQIVSTATTGTSRIFNFNGGTLKAVTSSLSGSFMNSGVVSVANVRNGGAVIDTNGLNVTIAQALSHSTISGDAATDGGLTKNGSGTLTLPGANSYNGPTMLNSGTLNLTGSLSSSVTVNSGATLSGTGTTSGGVTMFSGGALVPGNAGAGFLTLSGTLTLNDGSALNMQLGAPGSSTKVAVGGPVTASGTSVVNVTALSGFGAGTYPLITSTAINAGNFVLGTVPAGYRYLLSANNGTLSLTVAMPLAAPASLTATGTSSSVVLNWAPSSGAASYNVKRATTSGGPYSTVANPATTSYSDTSVANGTTYYYVVSAVDAVGESANSAQVSATPFSALQFWRQAYFGTTANSGDAADSADPDGDGATNAQEYAAGTDPKNASDVFKAQISTDGGPSCTLRFPGKATRTYTIEFLVDLRTASWTTLETISPTADGEVSRTYSKTGSQAYYRVRTQLP